jgi:tripartite-type tricarboxylate transporter receptor subunit TctC
MLHILLISFALLAGVPASAQSWPTKPVKLIVPFPPGGSADPIARVISAKLAISLGQPFIVENKPGASGSIGTGIAAKSPPDGYTFVVVFDTHAVNPFLIADMPFDTQKDLQPVMLVGVAPLAIATLPTKPYKNLADVVAAAKRNPNAVTFGSVQNGSTGHLEMLLWQKAAGVRLTHAPYRGAAPMVTDALGGHIELAIGSAAVIAPQVRSGKLRGIAVTSENRSSAMPEVSTLVEQGYPNLNAYAWWGIYAPAGLPKVILEKFHAEVVKAFRAPDVVQLMQDQLGMQLVLNTPEEMQKFVNIEMLRWSNVIKENGIKLD